MGVGKIAGQVGHACSSVVWQNPNRVANWFNYGGQKKSSIKDPIGKRTNRYYEKGSSIWYHYYGDQRCWKNSDRT